MKGEKVKKRNIFKTPPLAGSLLVFNFQAIKHGDGER